jgi:hypothetical protein
MRSGFVMVLKILGQDAAQVMLVEDDDVIQTFAADRADEALDIWILPRGPRRGNHSKGLFGLFADYSSYFIPLRRVDLFFLLGD